MRQQTTRMTPQPGADVQRPQRQVASRVAQTQVDNIPSYVPQMHDPDAEALIKGLSQFQPALENWVAKKEEEAGDRATLDRMAGKEAQEDSNAYTSKYMAVDGFVKGQADGSQLLAKYQTEFDKDKGNLDQWLAENHEGRLKGIDNQHYTDAYGKALLPTLQAIRKEHFTYQQKAVEARVESNAMQLLDGGVRAYVTHGQPIPDGYVEAIQTHVGESLGVSQQRFQELLFETVRRVGEDGHFDAFDVLKKPRADGSPGLYYDPAWKSKIDQAELHSYSVYETRSKAERQQRYNTTMYDIFAADDPKEAQRKFNEAKVSGLFKGDAEGLIKWGKLLDEKVDGKPDVRQLEAEGNLLAKVYKGSLNYDDVLKAQSRGDITSSQRKSLMGEIRRVQHENRTLAAQEGAANEKIYKSKDFGSAMDYLEGVLRPRPQDPMAMDKKEMEFDHLQLAQAKREFFTASEGKKPGELQDIADGVAQRYLKRRQEQAKGGMTPEQKQAAVAGQVPYKTLTELRQAVQSGAVSIPEARRYEQFLKRQGQ